MEVLTPNNKALFYGRLIVLVFLIRIITLYPFHSPEYIFYAMCILGIVLPNLKKKLCKIIVDGENVELVYKTIFNSSSKKFNRADINIRVEEKGKMVNGKKEKLIFSENDTIIDEITTANFKDINYKQLCN
jgi:hypothetical protein